MTEWNKRKQVAQAKIDASASDLNNISQEIWSHPELGYEEHHAHKILTDYLEKKGFEVTRNYHLDTAFKATYGTDGGVHVCVICEYDALPEIGHACGHNLIAECGAAAGLGIKAAMELDGTPIGRVTVLGTPAEEGAGGKIDLIKAGAFQGMDVAMMAHPYAYTVPQPVALSMLEMKIHFTGLASHASAVPWEGVNALDAAVMCYNSISVMRQQLKPEWRVHGIFTNGGAKPNIIPEEAELFYYLRAPTQEALSQVKKKVVGCAQGAAVATGCECTVKDLGGFANVVTNPTVISIYKREASQMGVVFDDNSGSGSTDMGNVSYVVPSIHPMYDIGTMAANHSRPFTAAAGAAAAQPPTLVQAKSLALTALEVMKPGNEEVLANIKKDFALQMGGAKA
ncbi:peptidase M20 domain-containing protein 2 [Strongylocentrotus purpuratus]|uniref:Peptidase M20 domain-containing protein 2 n=1 Tax=Strongylocentrotus purpuratus TaxID=7668 RepID=A0A7M7SYD7_STRPU|nr:peptidase M20 domain-containing protein 2 [Strongylocentrotus purpuratus]